MALDSDASRWFEELQMRTMMRFGHVWSADEMAPETIALDGAVAGPLIDPERRRFSFDHHQECLRMITSATCRQVLDATLLGLDPSAMTALVNDIDADTVLAVWLLRHHRRWRVAEKLRRVRPLVESIGAGDAHGPSFPVVDPELARHFHVQIMAPVRRARPLPGEDAAATGILEECIDGLEHWWNTGLEPADLESEPEFWPEIRLYETWVMAIAGQTEAGRLFAGSRWLYSRGHDRIALAAPAPAERYRYTLARRSDLVVGFPLVAFYEALNDAERAVRGGGGLDPSDRWGGASSVGGSPRNGGSALAPEDVARVVNAVLGARR